ncbi:Leucine Rich Repeat [Seminavis robusta]|uniref:Leucine Rich Repeat n=1 Tax=Seminavis robusta TaxID=568900 RepID=A0A9N8DHL1_9STRA|nr:Leucine Rich Repeat [Seminavis robusta]|eukprot:Sro92_g048050.1 Leucine Rich Repeat (542) ;mRNA; r:38991-40895
MTKSNNEPPQGGSEAALDMSSSENNHLNLLKIVEKRIQDGQQHQVEKAKEQKEEESERGAGLDCLDSLTLRKVVEARIGLPVSNGTNSYLTEEQLLAKVAAGTSGKKNTSSPPDTSTSSSIARTTRTSRSGTGTDAASQPSQCPGAFLAAPGQAPVRNQELRKSLLGRESNRDSSARASSSAALSVATPVDDGSCMFPLPVAQEYDAERQPRHQTPKNETTPAQERRNVIFALVITFVVGLAAFLVVFLLLHRENDTTTATTPEISSASASNTIAEPAITILSPKEHILQFLPASTIREIELHPDTAPQAKALQWMLKDPYYYHYNHTYQYSSQRVQQRFALATLYYSTNGHKWFNQTNWLQYGTHECSWFSRHWFGDVELYMASSTAHTFTLMYALLASANSITGSIPSEYGLLTSLVYSLLSQNRISGTLPTELAGMSALEWFYLYSNQATGTIPPAFLAGHGSSLQLLNLYGNQLTGPLPSEIGLMSNNMALLALSDNQMSSTVPTELGLLTEIVSGLSMNRNNLQGTIRQSSVIFAT